MSPLIRMRRNERIDVRELSERAWALVGVRLDALAAVVDGELEVCS